MLYCGQNYAQCDDEVDCWLMLGCPLLMRLCNLLIAVWSSVQEEMRSCVD